MQNQFSFQRGELWVENVPLSLIAQKYGTPCYVYSQSAVEAAYGSYADALHGLDAKICYAVKANGNQAILGCLGKKGAGADVVSGGELRRALQAGIDPGKIVFSGAGKEGWEIKYALESGILQINVESESEIELIAEVARSLNVRAPVAFRVNPDVLAQTHAKISTGHSETKFGINIGAAAGLYRKAAQDPHLSLEGLAVHIGSQLTDIAPLEAAWQQLNKLALALEGEGLPVPRLDAGGGLGISYAGEAVITHRQYAAALRKIFGSRPFLIEPGRSIVGQAGILLTKLLVLKQGKEKNFAILDAGMGDLLRPALYDAWHDIQPVLSRDKGAVKKAYDLVGPICETGDAFASDRSLPELHQGELMAIMSTGAYGAVMSSEYNSRPLAPEIMVKGSEIAVIRKKGSIEDMIARDILPHWL